MFTKIVVPIDGSDPSNAGVDLAVAFARDYKAELVFCHVVDMAQVAAITYPGVDVGLILDAGEETGRAMLARAQEVAQAANVRAAIELHKGLRLDVILQLIKDRGADLVVMGSHGRGGLSRAVIGSTTESVLRHSPVPVLVAAHTHVLAAT